MGCVSTKPKSYRIPKLEEAPTGDEGKGDLKTDDFVTIKPSTYIGTKKTEFNKIYKPCKKLGSGAYGDVYLCKRVDTSMEFAVKVINKQRVTSKKLTDDLLKEVQYLKELDHPNIAKLHDVYEDRMAFYIVIDVCYGGELFDEIIRRQRITEHDSSVIIKQVLSGVCYLHKHKIVHRDLKPENLLLETKEKDSRIKIVDFGLSTKLKGDILKERLGTVYYIAPEVLYKRYDEKCDVWSCGVILYILLCGYPPFTAKEDDDIIRKVKLGKYSFPSEEWSTVSNEAKDLINLMLTYDPQKRISAGEALKHPWIEKYSKIQKNGPHPVTRSLALFNLRNFTKTQKLAQAAMLLMANKFTSNEEINELSKLFSELDTNGDGTLDRDELIHGYKGIILNMRNSCGKLSNEEVEKEVDEIIKTCDLDHNGTIDYSEFITACIDKCKLLSMERLKLAFSTFDVDGSGKISKEELSQVFGITNMPDMWCTIMDEIDTNHDGEIDFEEFVNMLNKITVR